MSPFCCLGSGLGVQLQGFDAVCSCHKSPALIGVRKKCFHMVAQVCLLFALVLPLSFSLICLAVADAIKTRCVCSLSGLLSGPYL